MNDRMLESYYKLEERVLRLEAELENSRQYASGLENAQGFLDRKIADLQAEKESLEVQIMYALEKLDKFVASIKQALKGNK